MKSRCPHLAHRAVWRRLACATLAVLVAACGDGGTAPEPPPPPNRAPVASGTIPAQTLTEGQPATVNVASLFSDPDGDALSFTASTSNAGVAAATVSGSTVTITAVAAGTATITVTARDPGGLTAALSANVAVEPANRAPVVTGSVPTQSLTAGQSVQVNLAPFFSDPDGDALTYTAASSNTAIVTASVSGSTVTITAAIVGSATITVSAADPGGLSASLSASVMVGTAGAPDLVFTGVMPTSINGSPGETVMATFTLRNRGNAASPPTTIRLMGSDDATISTADTEINSDRIDGLPAGGEGTIEVSLTLPQDASGTFYVGLCVDPVSGESNTSNNCSTGVRVTVGGSGGPDLVVSVSPSSVTVSPGGSFSYDVTVRNQGDASSAATEIQTYASDNSTISTSDTPIDDPVSVPSLGPSGEVGLTATFTVRPAPGDGLFRRMRRRRPRRVEHQQQLFFGGHGNNRGGWRWRWRQDLHDRRDDRDVPTGLVPGTRVATIRFTGTSSTTTLYTCLEQRRMRDREPASYQGHHPGKCAIEQQPDCGAGTGRLDFPFDRHIGARGAGWRQSGSVGSVRVYSGPAASERMSGGELGAGIVGGHLGGSPPDPQHGWC